MSKVGNLLRLAAVEDVTNSVDVWTFDPPATPPAQGTGTTTVIAAPPPAASVVTSVGTALVSQTATSTGETTTSVKPTGVHHISRAAREAQAHAALLFHRRQVVAAQRRHALAVRLRQSDTREM